MARGHHHKGFVKVGPCCQPTQVDVSPISCEVFEELAHVGAAVVKFACVIEPDEKARSSVSSLRHMSNVHEDVHAVQYSNRSCGMIRWMPNL